MSLNLSIRVCPGCGRRRLVKYDPDKKVEGFQGSYKVEGFYFCLYCGRLYEFDDIDITAQDFFEFGLEDFEKLHNQRKRFNNA